MTHWKTTIVIAIIWALGLSLIPNKVQAQGPPTFIDTCTVAGSLRFPELPLPGKFVAGEYEALRLCPNLGNCVLKISSAKVGKASLSSLILLMQGGALARTEAYTVGDKAFKKLYQTVVEHSGKPSKLVESNGRVAYHWEFGGHWPGTVTLLYNPTSERGEAILQR